LLLPLRSRGKGPKQRNPWAQQVLSPTQSVGRPVWSALGRDRNPDIRGQRHGLGASGRWLPRTSSTPGCWRLPSNCDCPRSRCPKAPSRFVATTAGSWNRQRTFVDAGWLIIPVSPEPASLPIVSLPA